MFELLRTSDTIMFLLLLSTLVLGVTAQVSTEICYNSEGLEDTSLIACAGNNGCCRTGDICYSNGLCKGSNDSTSNINYYYDGCTSPSWNLVGCAPQCLNKTSLEANGMQPCSGGTDGYSNYCCLGFDSTCDCTDQSLLVSVPVGTVVTLLLSSSSASSKTTTSSSTISSSEPTTSAFTSTSVPSSATAPATTDAVPQQTDQQNSGLSTGAIVGIAVGAAACIFLGIAAAWFLLKRRRQRQHQDDNNPLGTSEKSKLGEQRNYPTERSYVTPELDSRGHGLSQGFDKNRHNYTPHVSELPAQNEARAEISA